MDNTLVLDDYRRWRHQQQGAKIRSVARSELGIDNVPSDWVRKVERAAVQHNRLPTPPPGAMGPPGGVSSGAHNAGGPAPVTLTRKVSFGPGAGGGVPGGNTTGGNAAPGMPGHRRTASTVTQRSGRGGGGGARSKKGRKRAQKRSAGHDRGRLDHAQTPQEAEALVAALYRVVQRLPSQGRGGGGEARSQAGGSVDGDAYTDGGGSTASGGTRSPPLSPAGGRPSSRGGGGGGGGAWGFSGGRDPATDERRRAVHRRLSRVTLQQLDLVDDDGSPAARRENALRDRRLHALCEALGALSDASRDRRQRGRGLAWMEAARLGALAVRALGQQFAARAASDARGGGDKDRRASVSPSNSRRSLRQDSGRSVTSVNSGLSVGSDASSGAAGDKENAAGKGDARRQSQSIRRSMTHGSTLTLSAKSLASVDSAASMPASPATGGGGGGGRARAATEADAGDAAQQERAAYFNARSADPAERRAFHQRLEEEAELARITRSIADSRLRPLKRLVRTLREQLGTALPGGEGNKNSAAFEVCLGPTYSSPLEVASALELECGTNLGKHSTWFDRVRLNPQVKIDPPLKSVDNARALKEMTSLAAFRALVPDMDGERKRAADLAARKSEIEVSKQKASEARSTRGRGGPMGGFFADSSRRLSSCGGGAPLSKEVKAARRRSQEREAKQRLVHEPAWSQAALERARARYPKTRLGDRAWEKEAVAAAQRAFGPRTGLAPKLLRQLRSDVRYLELSKLVGSGLSLAEGTAADALVRDLLRLLAGKKSALDSLDLSHNRFSDPGAIAKEVNAFLRDESQNGSALYGHEAAGVKKLDLSHCGIGPRDAKRIAEALPVPNIPALFFVFDRTCIALHHTVCCLAWVLTICAMVLRSHDRPHNAALGNLDLEQSEVTAKKRYRTAFQKLASVRNPNRSPRPGTPARDSAREKVAGRHLAGKAFVDAMNANLTVHRLNLRGFGLSQEHELEIEELVDLNKRCHELRLEHVRTLRRGSPRAGGGHGGGGGGGSRSVRGGASTVGGGASTVSGGGRGGGKDRGAFDPDRADSYGWTLLHYAARKGNQRATAQLMGGTYGRGLAMLAHLSIASGGGAGGAGGGKKKRGGRKGRHKGRKASTASSVGGETHGGIIPAQSRAGEALAARAEGRVADVNTTNGDKKTALHLALEHEHMEVARLLLEHDQAVDLSPLDLQNQMHALQLFTQQQQQEGGGSLAGTGKVAGKEDALWYVDTPPRTPFVA